MHRKRNDYEIDSNEKYLLTKKLKNEDILLHIQQSTNNIYAQNTRLNVPIISTSSSTQSSSSIIPNRKRRSRNTQDSYRANSSAYCATTTTTTITDGQLRKRTDLSCVVCCAVAHGYNFDAISCESCKAFFRRNALFSLERLKCRRDGACEITLETRRRCKSCRLRKCFAVGMRKEWILTEEEKVNKKRRIEENRKLRVLNTDESMSSRDSLGKTDADLKSVLFNKTDKSLLKLNSSVQSNDIINNVVTAYNDGITVDLTGYGWSYSLARKITGLHQLINIRNNTAFRLISFYKRLYDFDILNEADKISLMKTNLPYVFFLHASLQYDPSHDVYHQENTTDKPLYGADIREAYGIDNYVRLTKVMRALNSIIQIDKRIIQIALVIFLFSKGLSITVNSNQPTVNNHQQIFQTQNKYVEQLWLFIEKIYGRIRAIEVFSKLISKCLIMQELNRCILHDVYDKLDPCEVPSILRSLMQPA